MAHAPTPTRKDGYAVGRAWQDHLANVAKNRPNATSAAAEFAYNHPADAEELLLALPTLDAPMTMLKLLAALANRAHKAAVDAANPGTRAPYLVAAAKHLKFIVQSALGTNTSSALASAADHDVATLAAKLLDHFEAKGIFGADELAAPRKLLPASPAGDGGALRGASAGAVDGASASAAAGSASRSQRKRDGARSPAGAGGSRRNDAGDLSLPPTPDSRDGSVEPTAPGRTASGAAASGHASSAHTAAHFKDVVEAHRADCKRAKIEARLRPGGETAAQECSAYWDALPEPSRHHVFIWQAAAAPYGQSYGTPVYWSLDDGSEEEGKRRWDETRYDALRSALRVGVNDPAPRQDWYVPPGREAAHRRWMGDYSPPPPPPPPQQQQQQQQPLLRPPPPPQQQPPRPQPPRNGWLPPTAQPPPRALPPLRDGRALPPPLPPPSAAARARGGALEAPGGAQPMLTPPPQQMMRQPLHRFEAPPPPPSHHQFTVPPAPPPPPPPPPASAPSRDDGGARRKERERFGSERDWRRGHDHHHPRHDDRRDAHNREQLRLAPESARRSESARHWPADMNGVQSRYNDAHPRAKRGSRRKRR